MRRKGRDEEEQLRALARALLLQLGRCGRLGVLGLKVRAVGVGVGDLRLQRERESEEGEGKGRVGLYRYRH